MQQRAHAVAALYKRLWKEIDTIQTEKIVSQFLFNVDLPRIWFLGKRCLDVGCGSGFAVFAMEQVGARCYAIDLERSSLQAVQARLGGRASARKLVSASALELPFAPESFDFVHCNGVLHHTLDPRTGFAELVRVLKPGGTLFVSLYGKGGLYGAIVGLGRSLRPLLPYGLVDRCLGMVFRDRRVPNSFVPAKVSVLDNLYVPIRESYREVEIRSWFDEEGFAPRSVQRTRTTIYDHTRPLNRFIHGEGYLQLRAIKPGRE